MHNSGAVSGHDPEGGSLSRLIIFPLLLFSFLFFPFFFLSCCPLVVQGKIGFPNSPAYAHVSSNASRNRLDYFESYLPT